MCLPPPRHVHAAQLIVPNTERQFDDSKLLPSVLTKSMRDIDIPSDICADGYSAANINNPVAGQHYVASNAVGHRSLRTATEDDIAGIFDRSLKIFGEHPARILTRR